MPQAAPPAPSAPAPTEKPKGAVGIWIGVLLIVGGIILGIALVVSGAKSLLSGFDDLQRVPINGGGVVRIEEPGTQTIYAERPSAGSGTSFSSNTFGGFGPDVDVRVIAPGGGDVTVNTSSARETYTYDGKEGISIGTFYADTPGTYRIVTRLQDQSTWNTIAVGSALELSGIGAILGGIFGGGLVVLIGIVLVIVFAIRRSRSKKRLVQAASPYPGAYGAGAAGWPAAPGYQGPTGYGAPGAPGGYGAPPAPGSWTPPSNDNPGWAPPPVANPGPSWTPPTSPPPQAPPSAAPSEGSSWQPPAPAVPPPWQPGGADAPPPSAPAADPLAPSWDPPATADAPPPADSPPPPPPPQGDGGTSS